LREGLVITIEPFEHTLIITRGRPIVVT
jgi:hypothetical protein